MRGVGLIPGAGAPGEATVSHPFNDTTVSLLETWAARTSGSPICPHPLCLFPTQSSICPGGGAHSGRGMQPLISDTWTAELGATAARHGSTSWRLHVSAPERGEDPPVLSFLARGSSHTRIYLLIPAFCFWSFWTVRGQNQLCSMRNHAHHLVSQCAAVRLLPADLPHPHQR